MGEYYAHLKDGAVTELIAHWRESDKQPQLLITHLEKTAGLASGFCGEIGLPEIGEMLGLLHDFGKASDEFQMYLRSGEGLIDPDDDEYVDVKAQKGKIDHSTAGAQLIFQKLHDRGRGGRALAQFMALSLASHHSGMTDCITPEGEDNFQRRIQKSDDKTHCGEAMEKLTYITKQLERFDYDRIAKSFLQKLISMREENDSESTLRFKQGLLARLILSCLLDADRLDTADFEFPKNEILRNYGKYQSWDVLVKRLESKFDEFANTTARMPSGRALEVCQLRARVAQACLDSAPKSKGIYQLSVPTGGGKTLASLRFAIQHARAHTIHRVIYVIPYTSIIDQNAEEVRRILEDKDERGNYLDQVVIEHHSNLTPDEETRRHNLLAENWDAPIVFTTQVQFLEALFGAGTRNARRMHQLTNSVIILDEIQTVPIKMVHMLNAALRFLVHVCGSTVVLCTATQPPYDKLPENPYRSLIIRPEMKIIQNEYKLYEKLKRVDVYDKRKPGGWSETEIADLAERALREKGSLLIVVNTRTASRSLYQEIKTRQLAEVRHLSTNMCPAHRMKVLDEVKERLKAGKPVICISTQLIEAGVDIDFGAVIRYLAGLDSVAQSAGRCNRHGIREGMGSVYVVNPRDENLARLADIKDGREKAHTVLDDFRDCPERFDGDRIGLNAITEYYQLYYHQKKNEMNYPVGPNSPVGRSDDLFNLLSCNTHSLFEYNRKNSSQPGPDMILRQAFQSAAKSFHVIDSATRGVIVPFEEGDVIIKSIAASDNLDKQYKLLKRAQRYSVNLFTHEFEKLSNSGAVREIQPSAGIYFLSDEYYSQDFGWCNESISEMKTIIG